MIEAGGLFPFAEKVRNHDMQIEPLETLPRPMTMAEKILARHLVGAENAYVKPGDSCLVNVDGGGPSGQAGAIRHGISRALQEYNVELRPKLKKAGFLTRDPRMKERKKYGQKGARARFQFSKR